MESDELATTVVHLSFCRMSSHALEMGFIGSFARPAKRDGLTSSSANEGKSGVSPKRGCGQVMGTGKKKKGRKEITGGGLVILLP